MAVKFKSILRGEPGVVGGGIKKYYAIAISSGEHSLIKLSTYISKATTVNKADVLAVLSSLVEFMIIELSDGSIIRLGELGSLRLSIHSEGVENEEDLKASSIKDVSIIFTPGAELRKTLKTLDFEKISEKSE